jgi:mRNA interferase MazF
MKRGEVYDARLDPVEGSEQGGTRPVVIVSRDTMNAAGNVVIAVPCTTYREGRRVYPSQVLVERGEGGLTAQSVILDEQVRVINKTRLARFRGTVSENVMAEIEKALLIAMDLPGQ